MEYLNTIPDSSYILKLPKCGSNRNVVDCSSVTETQLLDEERCINTLNVSAAYLHEQKSKHKNADLLETKQEALQKLLLNHPFPRYQGPFEKHITDLQYDCRGEGQACDKYTFYSYTTFIHENNQPCKQWSMNSEQIVGEPKHVLTFTTTDMKNELKLWGPASDLNMSIM
jgi:hypothetical protein